VPTVLMTVKMAKKLLVKLPYAHELRHRMNAVELL
jgi:hypothetical protein